MIGAKLADVVLGEVRIDLDLVDGGGDLAFTPVLSSIIGRRASPRTCSHCPHGWAVAFSAPWRTFKRPGVTVVNIDNGYGAACAALRIIHAFAEPRAGANPR